MKENLTIEGLRKDTENTLKKVFDAIDKAPGVAIIGEQKKMEPRKWALLGDDRTKYAKIINMRTTIEIPEDLLRRAKAEAALRGIRLKDYVAEALRLALYGEPDPPERERSADTEDKLLLGEDCVFPLIRGECGPALRRGDSERLDRILEEEDDERALGPGGR